MLKHFLKKEISISFFTDYLYCWLQIGEEVGKCFHPSSRAQLSKVVLRATRENVIFGQVTDLRNFNSL